MSYALDFSINLGSAGAGLTDLRAQLVDTTGANVGSAVSAGFVEIGTSSGFFLWHYASFPDGHRGGVKFYSNAASSTILAFAAVNPEEAENVDAKTSSRLASASYTAPDNATIASIQADTNDLQTQIGTAGAGLTALPALVWAAGTRTLTSFGTLVADIWSYATRTLTTTANNNGVAVDGSDINITIGATFDATISGLSISASWSKVYFTVKHQHSDGDSEAIVQIVVSNPGDGSDGLKYLNEAAGTANQGSLTVNQGAGTVRIILADDASVTLEERAEIYYDLKQLVSGGTSNILTSGTCNIVPAVTLSIS